VSRADLALGVPVSAVPYPSPVAGGLTLIEQQNSLTAITAHATPHTKGSWVELIASTIAHTDWLTITYAGQMAAAGVDTRGLLDVGIGAAASEVAIISSIPVGFMGNGSQISFLPIRIPKGSRVAMRAQAAVGGDTINPSIGLFASSAARRSPSKLVDLNADLAASTSTAFMTSSATWTEMVAATAQPFQGLVAILCGGASSTWSNDTTEILSLGIGASGAETVLGIGVPQIWSSSETIGSTSLYAYNPQLGIHYSGHVPAGTRVVTKITTGRAYKGAIVFGVPYR